MKLKIEESACVRPVGKEQWDKRGRRRRLCGPKLLHGQDVLKTLLLSSLIGIVSWVLDEFEIVMSDDDEERERSVSKWRAVKGIYLYRQGSGGKELGSSRGLSMINK